MNTVKISNEEFNKFLKTSLSKSFVKDWLDLAKIGYIPLPDSRWKTEELTRVYVKFFAYFFSFSRLATEFYFTFCEKKYDKPTEERISFFIKQIISEDSDILLADYNPFKTNTLDLLLTFVDDNSKKVGGIDDLFRNIFLLHKKIFVDSQEVDIKLLQEGNAVLSEFFTKINKFL